LPQRVQKLHLVGVTTDRQGLILSARRGSRSGGYSLVVDDALADLVDDLRSESADEDDGDVAVPLADRVESRLPVREVQARLRRGRSIDEVAKQAGVDPSWVERFAAPVYAERAQVVSRVRSTPLRRPRLGTSGLGIGAAVSSNLVDRGLALTPGEIDAAWSAHQVGEGRWAVRFGFRYRGRDQVLRFDLDEESGEVVAADRMSAQFGFVEPDARARAAEAKLPKPAARPPEPRPTAKRATVATGFRADSAKKAVSRPAKERERAASAMSKAAARGAVEAERAARRKAKEKRELAARLERARQAEERTAAAEARRRAREAAATAKADKAKEQAKKQAKKAKEAKKAKKATASAAKTGTAKQPKRAAKRSGTKAAATRKRPNAATKRTTAPTTRSRGSATTNRPARRAAETSPSAASRRTDAPARPSTSSARSPEARRTERARTGSAPIRPSAPDAADRTEVRRVAPARPGPADDPRNRGVVPRPAAGGGAAESRPPVGPADRWDSTGSGGPQVLFRSGLVEQAAGDGDGPRRTGARASTPDANRPTNGVGPGRAPAARPRRTRPLRAT
jgi:chemotaxis protein histidine kinase CheA